jgi:hypothetical protein
MAAINLMLHSVLAAGANYCFASSDADFLKANFDSVVTDLLPWALLTGKSGVNRELADVIRRSRGDGTALLEVCNHRNEAVASRYVWEGQCGGTSRRLLALSSLCC